MFDSKNGPAPGFTTSISQYSTDIMSNDYVERAFIFGSTQVTVTQADLQKLQFVVHPDGSREIRNLRITPKNDNFDYTGGSSSKNLSSSAEKMMVDKANAVFKAALDPKGFGKTVPIEYTDTQKLPFTNVTDTQFRQMQQQRSRQKMSDTLIEETGIPLITHSASLTLKLLNSPSLYTNDWVHSFKKSLEDIGNMHRKTRDIIDKDPNMMSQNGFTPYSDRTTPTLTLNDMPPKAQELCRQCRERLVNHYEKNGMTASAAEFDRMAAAVGVEAYAQKLPEIQAFNIKNDTLMVGHRTPNRVLTRADVDFQTALNTPVEESISRSHQVEHDLARAAEQREMEIAQYHAQSRGMSFS